mgnify:CR=1 FL=1
MTISRLKTLLEDPLNDLVEQAMDSGGIPIGYTCSHVPEVLLTLPPLFPLRMRAPGVGGTEMADIYQSNLNCSYTRSLLEFAMDLRYDFLGGWVHAASCDHLRRLHDNLDYLAPPEFSHVLDVPHRLSRTAVDWFVEDLQKFIDHLVSHFGVDASSAAITQAIIRHNAFMKTLQLIGDLRKRPDPPLTGTEFHILMTAATSSPRDLIEPQLEDIRKALQQKESGHSGRARLMIVGGQLDDPCYIETIESTGAIVVADRICTGSIPGLTPIPVRTDDPSYDPIRTIAEHTLGTPSCPRMMEDFDKRLAQILETARTYKVDGIIIEWIKFCDTWGVEIGALAPALRDAGYRVLCLEREYRRAGEGQLQTRVQAFLESMGQ